jgi:hypothetical protein
MTNPKQIGIMLDKNEARFAITTSLVSGFNYKFTGKQNRAVYRFFYDNRIRPTAN